MILATLFTENLTIILPYIVHYIQNIMVLQENIFPISCKKLFTSRLLAINIESKIFECYCPRINSLFWKMFKILD